MSGTVADTAGTTIQINEIDKIENLNIGLFLLMLKSSTYFRSKFLYRNHIL